MGFKDWFFKEEPVKEKNEMLEQFKEVNEALNEIGLNVYTEEGEDLRKVMAVEILSRKYPFIKNYQKDFFIKTATDESLSMIKNEKKLLKAKR